mmetsp:Transcript_10393/g.17164  ORF Transcript_10393/g.17164 Transcript_10393/m.17164 type:complete len:247 (-) Transcript_10393:157-897(-)
MVAFLSITWLQSCFPVPTTVVVLHIYIHRPSIPYFPHQRPCRSIVKLDRSYCNGFFVYTHTPSKLIIWFLTLKLPLCRPSLALFDEDVGTTTSFVGPHCTNNCLVSVDGHTKSKVIPWSTVWGHKFLRELPFFYADNIRLKCEQISSSRVLAIRIIAISSNNGHFALYRHRNTKSFISFRLGWCQLCNLTPFYVSVAIHISLVDVSSARVLSLGVVSLRSHNDEVSRNCHGPTKVIICDAIIGLQQ